MKRWEIPRHLFLTVAVIFSVFGSAGAYSPQDILNKHDPRTQSSGAIKKLTKELPPRRSVEKTTEGTVHVRTSLNIRTEPWGKIVGRFTEGDRVHIIGIRGDWYKIIWNGKTVYVHANYVSTPFKAAGQTRVEYPPPGGEPKWVDPGSQSTPADRKRPDSPPLPSGRGRFGAAPLSPMATRTSSEFGPRSLYGRSFHYGIDLPIPTGTRVNALGDGVVTAVSYEPAGGRFVKIKYSNGIESVYAHLKSASVRVGQKVAMGQEVARSDNTGQSTGPHLHLGIRKNGQLVNPRSIPGIPFPPRR